MLVHLVLVVNLVIVTQDLHLIVLVLKLRFFGGGGEGASAMPILGSIVGDTFATQTASLIGIKLTDGGGSYVTPPFVEIIDNCNNGYGAVARAVIDYDPNSPTYQQVVDVYIVTGEENYPVIEPVDGSDAVYTVDHVVVVDAGQDIQIMIQLLMNRVMNILCSLMMMEEY